MKLIKPSVELIKEKGTKLIELAGRVCYKSEDKITEDSHIKFYDMLEKRKHLSVFEHARYLIQFDNSVIPEEDLMTFNLSCHGAGFKVVGISFSGSINKYTIETTLRNIEYVKETEFGSRLYKLINGEEVEGMKLLDGNFYSFRIICDRGVSHELVRHRNIAISQESTRYCDYSSGKFNSELSFIKPYWMGSDEYVKSEYEFAKNCIEVEELYNKLKKDLTPQQRRAILPNMIKTEMIVTASIGQWRDMISLRTSEAAHPDIRIIFEKIKELIDEDRRQNNLS